MAKAADTFTWALHEASLKAYLGITGDGENVLLERWLASAAADCDRFMKWYYTDEDGDTVDLTPTDPSSNPLIEQGVYEWVRVFRQVSTSVPMGVKGAKQGTVSISVSGGVNGQAALHSARAAAEGFWEGEDINPLHGGKGYSA